MKVPISSFQLGRIEIVQKESPDLLRAFLPPAYPRAFSSPGYLPGFLIAIAVTSAKVSSKNHQGQRPATYQPGPKAQVSRSEQTSAESATQECRNFSIRSKTKLTHLLSIL